MTRFFDVTHGEVLINGKNVKDYEIKELNKQISIASQKAVFFSGDIKKNITYGSDDYDEVRFKKAIEVSQSTFVNELEEKENARVAQGGDKLLRWAKATLIDCPYPL